MNLSEKLIFKIINSFSVATLERLEVKIHQALFMKKMFDYHWQSDYLPPWHPSAADIENYQKIISNFDKKCRVLIFGPAREVWNLTVSAGFKPEASVEGKFDLVISDMVFSIIGVEEEFLNKIKNILSPGGIFIVRLHFFNEGLSELTAKEILDKSIGILDERLAANAISERIFDKFSDFKEAIEFMREAIKIAKGRPREKMIALKALRLMLNRSGISEAAQNKIQLENLLGKFFDIIDIKTAGDYPDAKFYPIYVLKARP